MKKLLYLLLFLGALLIGYQLAYAQDTSGQQKLLLNDKGSVIVGTTSATGEFRVIHNGVVVLTTESGGAGLLLENDQYLNWKNQAGTVYPTLVVDSNGDVRLRASLGESVRIDYQANNTVGKWDNNGLTMQSGYGIAMTTGVINATTAGLRFPNDTDLPATCTVGDVFIDTDDDACADAGGGSGAVCACLATDTWTEIS